MSRQKYGGREKGTPDKLTSKVKNFPYHTFKQLV